MNTMSSSVMAVPIASCQERSSQPMSASTMMSAGEGTAMRRSESPSTRNLMAIVMACGPVEGAVEPVEACGDPVAYGDAEVHALLPSVMARPSSGTAFPSVVASSVAVMSAEGAIRASGSK